MAKTHLSLRTFELNTKSMAGEGEGYSNELTYLINAIDIMNQFERVLDQYCENSNVTKSITMIYKVIHLTK